MKEKTKTNKQITKRQKKLISVKKKKIGFRKKKKSDPNAENRIQYIPSDHSALSERICMH